MNYFVIDIDIDGVHVSKMNVEKGEYRLILSVGCGTLKEQADIVAVRILKEKPSKVFVDKVGYGAGFLDQLKSELLDFGLQLKDDATVVYS